MSTGTDTGVTMLIDALWPDAAVASALALARWRHSSPPSGEVDVVARWPGPWRRAFEAVAPVHVVNDWAPSSTLDDEGLHDIDGVTATHGHRRIVRWGERVPAVLRDLHLRRAADGVRGAVLRRRLARHRGPVWVAGPRAARLVQYVPAGRRVVVHQPARSALPADLVSATEEDLEVLRHRPDAWVAGDEASAGALRRWGVDGEVVVVPDLLLLDEGQPDARAMRAVLEDEHGVPPAAPLVVSGGSIDWWEVPDSFVQVAWEAGRLGRGDLHWVWLAEHSTDAMLWPLRHDVAHAGLDRVVHVVRWRGAASTVLAGADVVLGSRRGTGGGEYGPLYETVARRLVRWAEPGEAPGLIENVVTVAPFEESAMATAVIDALSRSAGERADVRVSRGAAALGPSLWAVLHP